MFDVRWKRGVTVAVAALAFLAVGGALSAQQLTGNIFGHVEDEQQGRLPGVTVSLTGPTPARPQTTDARGEYRFLNLAPGVYTLTYDMQGFGKVTKSDVQVAVGQNTQSTATLRLSTVEAAVVVRGEAATLDTRRVATGANVSQVELKSIPTARDPWVILQTVPGVATDRVNVGGNESGQQSVYTGKGSNSAQNVWNLDGVTITDTAALGSSGTYYDFDSFEEMNATTGGSDITASTPGVQLNLVTKRGTNEVHGSARVLLTQDEWQSKTNLPGEDEEIAESQGFTSGNRITEIQDYGVEVGGPIIKDRVWLWGAYGRNQIDLLLISPTGTTDPASDRTTLEDTNGKLNIQFFEGTAGSASVTWGEKIKIGRSVGPTRTPPTGWNQGGFGGDPSGLYKGEISQVFSSRLFATASYSYFDGGFQLVPQAGLDVPDVFQDENGVWQNSYLAYLTYRPQHQVGANTSFFFNTGSAGHELKFGFSYRTTPVHSLSAWPGNGNWGYLQATGPGSLDQALLSRNAVTKGDLEYYNGFLGDTITFGNLTINAGVRYDLQRGNNLGSIVPANPLFPDILPGINGVDQPVLFEWEDFSPRLGVTYALGPNKKMLLKGSYARFVDQLGIGQIFHTNAAALAGIYYYWNDNGDRIVTRDEIDFAAGHQGFYNFDPDDPANIISSSITDPNFEAGQTDEIVVGLDWEVLPEFVVGASYTYRTYDGAVWTPQIGLTRDSFVLDRTLTNDSPGTHPDAPTFSEPLYRLADGIPVPPGQIQENRPDFETTYHGVGLNFQKRLSNRWMLRGNVGWADPKQKLGSGACDDPTNTTARVDYVANVGIGCPDGEDITAERSLGSGGKGRVYINSSWNFNIGGLYELPLGFNIAGNFYGREGYPQALHYRVNPGDGLGSRNVVIGKLDDFRYENVYNLDLRLEKVVNISTLQVALSADVFNVLNDGTVLQRQNQVNLTSFGQIFETQSPRVVRLGARVSF